MRFGGSYVKPGAHQLLKQFPPVLTLIFPDWHYFNSFKMLLLIIVPLCYFIESAAIHINCIAFNGQARTHLAQP
ncbi:MAG: hypothetical protein A2144_14575 [Chloroflexi bacterium RBG_16_50_9]|nr:MAG: hypothetical protein A2144_14575 [Chloroflexi bacterium RBG_16_50_9]